MIIAVSGCLRDEGVSYTEGTLAALVAAGLDPVTPIVVYDDLSLRGSAPSCLALLKRCAELYPGEDVLLLEDDVKFCVNAIPAIERVEFPDDCMMLSFFQNRKRFVDAEFPNVTRDVEEIDFTKCIRFSHVWPVAGIYMQPANRDFVYAQCLKLKAELVAYIATQELPSETCPTCGLGVSHAEISELTAGPGQIRDQMLGYFAAKKSKYIGQVSPGWVEHTGVMSAALARMYREQRTILVRAGNWISDDHDAMTDDTSRRWF